MKTIQSVLVSAVLAIGMAAPASAGVNDPEVIIYRFPGVLDTAIQGTAFIGIATEFHCTNFSGVTENIRFVTRGRTGALITNVAFPIAHLETLTAYTHKARIYGQLDVNNLNTGAVTQGTTAIAATSINIICTAVTIDAEAVVPNGFALRGIRFAPVPGSQE